MFRTIPRYEEDGLGLPYPVVLINAAEEEIDDNTGEQIGISVPDTEALAVAVAVTRALYPVQLSGQEIRFLRNVLNMTGKEMAQAIEVDPASFSRWENDKQTLGGWADKQVRYVTIVTLGDQVPHLSLDQKAVVKMDIMKRQPDAWPLIQMHRHHHNVDLNSDQDGWDTRLAA